MSKIMVAGIGTDVGKTLASAILLTLVNGDYWKPVQCGLEHDLDSVVIKNLVDTSKHHIYPSTYSLKNPLSPHHAAHLENIAIDTTKIIPPSTVRPLIIEGVGGVYAPLTCEVLSLDLFKAWNCKWIVVSRHYVGSINHTLLTLEVLHRYGISIAGLVFNGTYNPASEAAILKRFNLPVLGRLFPENEINTHVIKRYAQQWQSQLNQIAL